MKCPCEECISYAMCVGKTTVECDDFHSYASHIEVDYDVRNIPHNINSYWEYLNNILPNLHRISPERNTI